MKKKNDSYPPVLAPLTVAGCASASPALPEKGYASGSPASLILYLRQEMLVSVPRPRP